MRRVQLVRVCVQGLVPGQGAHLGDGEGSSALVLAGVPTPHPPGTPQVCCQHGRRRYCKEPFAMYPTGLCLSVPLLQHKNNFTTPICMSASSCLVPAKCVTS